MHPDNPDLWTESEWLQQLPCCARRLTCCEDAAADLAHAALYAFLDHFQHFSWQHDDPQHAWHWCCQKLRSLSLDARRRAQRHPTLSLEELSEGVMCIEMAAQVEGEADVEAFRASESSIDLEGESRPSDEAENGGQSDARDGNEEQGFSDDTGSAGVG